MKWTFINTKSAKRFIYGLFTLHLPQAMPLLQEMIQGASGQIYFMLWSGTGALLLSRSHMYYSSIIHSIHHSHFWVSLIVRHGVEDHETLKCPNPQSVTIFAKLKKDQAHKYQSSAYLRVLVGPKFQSEEEKWTSLISVQSVFSIQSKFAQIKVGVSGVRLSVRRANPLLPRTLAGLSGSSRSYSSIKHWTLGNTCQQHLAQNIIPLFSCVVGCQPCLFWAAF